MVSKIDLVQHIRANVDTHFERFVLRRAIDTETRRGRIPPGTRWSFTTDYAFAIEDAVCEFADLLTQAAIARRKALTKKILWEIVDTALRWAHERKRWDSAKTFVEIAMGKITGKVSVAAQEAFLKEVEEFEPGWQIQAINTVRLRLFLSSRAKHTQMSTDQAKLQIALIKKNHPKLSQQGICRKLDVYNERSKGAAPLPKEWQDAGFRSWVEAYDNGNLRPRVKKYISLIHF